METLPEITKVQELIYELKIEQVMSRPVITISPDATIAQLKEILRVHQISGVPVLEGGKLVGIISIEDLIKALEKGEMQATVGEKMTRSVITVNAQDSVVEAVKCFDEHKVGRLPVLDSQGQLVGILTSGDITRGLLHAIGLGYHREEIRRYRASHIFEDISSDRTSLILCYRIPARELEKAGEASSKIKKALYRLGAHPVLARRVAIAAYEAEMNLIIHTLHGGDLIAEIHPDKVRILAVDDGPGIPDIEQAMQPGYSTAPDWIRELGFGAGMGLFNIKRCSDQMMLDSRVGVGTRLEMLFFPKEEMVFGNSSPNTA
ncbi:MAG: CBS domain-containing protein [Anaerolineae bacterium]